MMQKAVAFLAPKKTRNFEGFYAEWIDILVATLLPVLNRSNADVTAAFLASHVDRIHQHFQSYYTALDAAAISSPHRNLPLLLRPPWLSPLQIPVLFLGDLHPFLFTTLLRSFILDRDEDSDDGDTDFDKDGRGSYMKSSAFMYCPEEGHGHSDGTGVVPDLQWRMAMAWKRPSGVLISRMDEIERWVRLMVPDLTSRIRASQQGFAMRLAKPLHRYEEEEGVGFREAVGRASEAEMKEMVSVFVDANRLRRSVMAEIVSATDVYQAAGFFKALGQFVAGLRDKNVVEKLEQCMVMLR